MQPILTLDRTALAVLIDGVVHVMLELQAPEVPAGTRAPIDTVVVLDRSGSMSGEPLDSVTRATAELVKLAGANDRIGVVAFDDDVDLVLPLAHHDGDQAARRVRGLRPGGSTNLSGGWLKAMEMLAASRRPDAVTRILLLTDGHANAGVRDAGQLAELARSAGKQGITTTCIGFDDGYDHDLLAGMADAGGGNDYWCAGPDQAAAVFRAEFEGLASVCAQNVSVELRPADHVGDWLVLNEYPVTEVPGGVQVNLGDCYGGERRRMVAMLRIPAQPAQGLLQVADLVLRYASVGDTVALHTINIPVTVQIGGDADSVMPDPLVTEQVLLLEAARQRKEANELADRGDWEQASRLMGEVAEKLARTSTSPEEVDDIRRDAVRLQQRDWDAGTTKKHFSAQRSAHKSRNLRFDPQNGAPSNGSGSNGPGSNGPGGGQPGQGGPRQRP